jgi:hypothetical protein
MPLNSDEMRDIYERTVIVRRPTYGIVKGYHELPYVCLGRALDSDYGALRIRGKIHVSPQILIRPQHYQATYEQIFGEDNVDMGLCGRVFGYLGFSRKPVECSSEQLEVKQLEGTVDDLLSRQLDDLERNEDITTGVIITPNSRYYPVSIERFIASILDDEFSL